MKIHGVGDGRTVELYTASYTGKLLYNARNLPIQQTLIVPRTCMAIQLYSARVYSRAIQYTAYTLYSPIRRPSDYIMRFGSLCAEVDPLALHGSIVAIAGKSPAHPMLCTLTSRSTTSLRGSGTRACTRVKCCKESWSEGR